MNKVINFHPGTPLREFNIDHHYVTVKDLIAWDKGNIHTSQMALLDRAWDAGYTIHIWYRTDQGYTFDEFYPGRHVYGKELRKEHSMQRLWVGGALGDHLVTGYRPGG